MDIIDSLEKFDQARAANLISCLNAVPPPIVDEFRGNLKFAPSGLAHSAYSMLAPYMANDRLPELFAHFGVSAEKFLIIRDKFCGAGTGDCFDGLGLLCDPDKCRENGPG